jgi:pyruvate ferredoxin oxidoreductase gamma subunit
MLNGGTLDALTHNTSGKNNADVRFNLPPSYDRAACIDCAKCMTVCADPGAILWEGGKMVGIDLHYCKGCMRCVSVCPETKKGKALTNPAGEGVSA